MTKAKKQSDQAEWNHSARRERRGRAQQRAPVQVGSGERGVRVPLIRDVAAIMLNHSHRPAKHQEGHYCLQRPYRCAAPCQDAPPDDHHRHNDQKDGSQLPESVGMLEQEKLHHRSGQAYNQNDQKPAPDDLESGGQFSTRPRPPGRLLDWNAAITRTIPMSSHDPKGTRRNTEAGFGLGGLIATYP